MYNTTAVTIGNYEPGQDRNVAALSNLSMCDGFLIAMNKDKIYFMKEALKEAKKALKIDEVPIGCVIIKDGEIIARGYNHRENKNLVESHAEMEAIRKANKKLNSWRLPNCDIYITLEPCMMCMGAIIQSRISHIYYGASDFKGGAFMEDPNAPPLKSLAP